MRVDVRPVQKLRGAEPLDVTAPLAQMLSALAGDTVDLTHVRLVCDWIQYKSNFRDVVDIRPVLAHPAASGEDAGPAMIEIAVDLRRSEDVDVEAATHAALARLRSGRLRRGIYLEPWTAGRTSCIWRFNALYWQALGHWEAATGREYERALPGGATDARNLTAVHELIHALFRVWDELDARNALPDELYVVELGVGNGGQARTWLDEFVTLDRAHGRDYYRRLHYILCDYSPHVLARAEAAVAGHAAHTSAMVVDATRPLSALGFLRHKAFLVYVSNVYDNLPSDEIARIGGRVHQVEVRAWIADDAAARLAAEVSSSPDAVPGLVDKLLRLGPELLSEAMPAQFPSVGDAVGFWRECWGAVRLEERYVPLEGLDAYEIAPGLSGEHLRPQLDADGDVRLHVNNGAVASFAGTLPLLHPFGRLQCLDLFVESAEQYHSGFHGPGKYDGSVVNWVNGPLLRQIGRRHAVDVTFTPFRHGARSSITTLTASLHD
ncbi:hypothetical protein [Desertimonas flava]|uniref:hypothetical protein n=1 Tax=Desertimonas flava TaxID=2064846 RepID=UPI0013C4F099|nr:hypothetical protein [Desertimonas flava]